MRTEKLSDLDFVDDITLLSDDLSTAQELLAKVEAECGRTGLHLSAQKTEYMAFNVNSQGPLMASNVDPLKQVKDFNYLGSRMESTQRDIKERKASAWRAVNNLKKIWTSNLSRGLKTRIF